MKKLIACTATVAVAMLAVPAMAGTIFTPPLPTLGATTDVNCRVLNNGSRAAEDVAIEIRSSSGAVTETATWPTIAPGRTQSVQEQSPGGIHYCRVDGKRVSKSKTEVTMCAIDANGNYLECVTAP